MQLQSRMKSCARLRQEIRVVYSPAPWSRVTNRAESGIFGLSQGLAEQYNQSAPANAKVGHGLNFREGTHWGGQGGEYLGGARCCDCNRGWLCIYLF